MANPALDALSAQIQKATTVENSADIFITGVSAMIANAVAAAIANGATAAQLAPVSDLGTALDAQSDKLQADLLANTPPTA